MTTLTPDAWRLCKRVEIATVPIHYVNSILTAAEKRGFDQGRLIARSGLSDELLKEEKTRVSAEIYVRLAAYLMRELQDESCGLIAQRTKPGSLAMMCHASINSATLGQFMVRCTRFYALINDCVEAELSREKKHAVYGLRAQPGTVDADGHIVMVLLALMYRLASWTIGQPIVLEQVNITRPAPLFANDYNELFQCRVKFGASLDSLWFSSSYLDLPLKQDQQSLNELLANAPLSLMKNIAGNDSVVIEIKRLIRENLPEQPPSLEEVASKLNMSSATMRRRLSKEGSSYKQLKDDVRRDLAIYLLSRNTSIHDVAQRAGFVETTSFFRAFKRWTGSTPKAYLS